MPLVLSDEQQMLRESARGYLAEQAPVAHLRKLRDERDDTGFSRALWRGFAEMGWAGVLIAEEFGGVGLGHVEAGVLLEEMGRTLAPSPFLSTAVVAASAIGLAGSAQHKAQHLPRIAAGELVAALAIDEGAKHKPSRIALAAARHANGFRLNGTKTFVIDGHVADLLIVAARTAGGIEDKQGVTLFLVDAKTPGLARERTIMVDSRNAARLAFENVDVTADAVLGEVDEGAPWLERVLSIGRAGLAAELVGVSSDAPSASSRRWRTGRRRSMSTWRWRARPCSRRCRRWTKISTARVRSPRSPRPRPARRRSSRARRRCRCTAAWA